MAPDDRDRTHGDDQTFHVTPFEWREGDGPSVLFLVVGESGQAREIVVERDEQGFHHFSVDGGHGRPYDPEVESFDLTESLMTTTDRILGEVDSAKIAATGLLHRMARDIVRGHVQ